MDVACEHTWIDRVWIRCNRCFFRCRKKSRSQLCTHLALCFASPGDDRLSHKHALCSIKKAPFADGRSNNIVFISPLTLPQLSCLMIFLAAGQLTAGIAVLSLEDWKDFYVDNPLVIVTVSVFCLCEAVSSFMFAVVGVAKVIQLHCTSSYVLLSV